MTRTVLTLLAGVAVFLPAPVASARDEPATEALPADLALVPREAAGFVSVRIADLWADEGTKVLRAELAREDPDVAKRLSKNIAVAPADVRRLTYVNLATGGPLPEGPPSAVIVATTGAYDEKKVLAFLGGAKEETHGGKTCHVRDGMALCPFDKTTFVVGQTEAVATILDRAGKNAGGPLAPVLAEAAGKHQVTIGVRPAVLLAAFGNELPAELKPFKPLLEAKAAGATLDLGKETRGEARLYYARASEAKDAAAVAKGALVLLRRSLPALQKELDKEEETQAIKKVLEAVGVGLKTAPIEATGNTVTLSLTVNADVPAVSTAVLETVRKVRGAANAIASLNNLKRMALSMMSMADANRGVLPAAAIYSKDGKPLLSWRVAILPYVEADNLYKEFHLDEPWDSDHNKKLLPRMPKVYVAPAAEPSEGKTHYRVFHGPEAAFQGMTGLRYPAAFTDGTSLTILIVEAAEAVPWTKPDELPFDPKKDLPALGIKGNDYFLAAFADGGVKRLKKKIDPKVLKALVTPAGGEAVEVPKE